MSSRRGDTQGSVLSFSYLDVLVCTMGSLVLMLVMFSERAKRAALAEAEKPQTPAAAAPASEPDDADELAKNLAKARKQQAELERARAEARQRLGDEQQRVSHLEEHQRRLEHELAKLHLVLKQLEATEQQQVVDQDQAEKELVRLRQLIRDTEDRVAAMQQEESAARSYAIVPYKGPNGTYRRPVYIECTREAIILQPEGVRLTADDFNRPLSSGNPLAAAIRAAQEEINARTPVAADAERPDPYPLFIVRPDGVKAYEVALAATRTWDSDYGYEFVDADWKLAYPEADPRLAQVMSHAIETARERQKLLAMAAPSRYGGRIVGGSPGSPGHGGGPGGYGTGGSGSVQQAGGFGADDAYRTGDSQTAGESASSLAGGTAAGQEMSFAAMASGSRYGEIVGGSAGGGQGGGPNSPGAPGDAQPGGSGTVAEQGAAGATAAKGVAPGAPGAAANGQPANGQPAQSAAPAANSFASSGGGYSSTTGNTGVEKFDPHAVQSAAADRTSASSAGAASSQSESGSAAIASFTNKSGSAADTRGANWANKEANRRAAPIARPIRLVVRTDQLSVIDVNEAPNPAMPQGQIVSFRQPDEKVLDQLAAAIQQQVRDWGLAGQGMYWRPTLIFQVAPGAEPHAQRLAQLMQNSGVDVRLPQGQQTAARPEDPSHATR